MIQAAQPLRPGSANRTSTWKDLHTGIVFLRSVQKAISNQSKGGACATGNNHTVTPRHAPHRRCPSTKISTRVPLGSGFVYHTTCVSRKDGRHILAGRHETRSSYISYPENDNMQLQNSPSPCTHRPTLPPACLCTCLGDIPSLPTHTTGNTRQTEG